MFVERTVHIFLEVPETYYCNLLPMLLTIEIVIVFL